MAEMTTDTRRSEIQNFLRLQKAHGGIVPSKLKHGEEVLVETNNFVYRFKVTDTLDDNRRFLLDTGAPSCRGNDVCVNIRSHSSKLKYEIPDWVGKDMRLILKFTNGNSILIGEVRGASIIGKRQDGSEYRFEFWDK